MTMGKKSLIFIFMLVMLINAAFAADGLFKVKYNLNASTPVIQASI